MPLAEVKVPALDRGFLFGDAVYEVLRIYGGRPWLLDEHWERLAHSLDAIRIGGVDLDRLRRRMQETIAAGPFTEAIAYIQITRGAGPTRTHAFPARATPLEFLYVQASPIPTPRLGRRAIAAITLPDIRWDRCDIKSTNLLGQRAGRPGGQGSRLRRSVALPARRHPDRGDPHQRFRRARRHAADDAQQPARSCPASPAPWCCAWPSAAVSRCATSP